MNDDIKPNRLGNLYGEHHGTGHAGNVWSKEAISPTINTCQGGNREPLIIEDFYSNRDIRVYDKYSPSIRSERSGLKVVENICIGSLQDHAAINKDGISPTLTQAMGSGGGQTPMIIVEPFVVQKCGDRDKEGNYSVHDYSNCIPANPMSDRGQLVVECKDD